MQNTEINNHKLNITKIIDLLSSCGSIQDIMINSLIKYHEKNKVMCGKYFYEVYIHLNKDKNTFRYRSASFHFLKQSDLAHDEIVNILAGLNNMAGVDHSWDEFAGSFLALVRLYSAQPYKYLYISIIIDYGGNTGLSHQTALIIDLQQGQFLYYEPYGKYEKYEASYRLAVLEFLKQYEFPAKFYTENTLNYDTWHNYFGMPMGIQQILMHAHNESKTQYATDKDALMEALKEKYPSNYVELVSILDAGKNKPAHKDDYTFDTLQIMSYFVDTPFEDDDSHTLHNLEHMALELYFKYNSKTCVTITLVEMHYFFTRLVGKSRQEQTAKLNEYYREFQLRRNHKLVDDLDKYINMALHAPVVYDWARNPIGKMCELIHK